MVCVTVYVFCIVDIVQDRIKFCSLLNFCVRLECFILFFMVNRENMHSLPTIS